MFNSGDILLRPTGSGTLAYSGPGAWALHQNYMWHRFESYLTSEKTISDELFCFRTCLTAMIYVVWVLSVWT